MKILVISLLRLGDIYMHLHLVADLKKKWPQAHIDMLINSQFSHVKETIESIDHLHLFSRNELQQDLVDGEGNVFLAYAKVEKLIHSLNEEKYDLVYDFTHTFLSHKLLDLIEAKEKKGSTQGYFNDIFSISKHTSFHYVDALRRSLSIEHLADIPKSESRQSQIITIQPLTSDKKKNWPLKNYQFLIEHISRNYPEYKISIVGAESEKNILENSFREFANVKIEILNLTQLQFLLWETQLLISADTAVIHLASHCRTPVLGIYVGSADPFKTAPYLMDARVLHATEECAPCSHSKECPFSEYRCHQSISKEDVANLATDILIQAKSNFKKLTFHAYQCDVGVNKQLTLKDLSSDFSSLYQLIRQQAWSEDIDASELTVNENLLTDLVEFNHSLYAISQVLSELESWTRELSNNLVKFGLNESDWDLQFSKLKTLVKEYSYLCTDSEQVSQIEELTHVYNSENPYLFFKKVKWVIMSLTQIVSRQQILLHSLIKKINGKGLNYVSGSRKLS